MSKIPWAAATLLTLLASAAPTASAAEPPELITDRPDFTESAAVVPIHHAQVESGFTASREDDTGWELGELLLRVSVHQRLELRFELPSWQVQPGATDAFGDFAVGFKAVLREQAAGAVPQFAVIVATTVPRGGDQGRAWQPEVKLCAAWDLGERTGLAANLNVASAIGDGDGNGDRDRFDQLSASLSLAQDFGGGWGGFLEAFGFDRETPDGPATSYANAGVTYQVSSRFQLDARVGFGLVEEATDSFIGLGAAYRW